MEKAPSYEITVDGSETLFVPLIEELAGSALQRYEFANRILPKLLPVIDNDNPEWRKGTIMEIGVRLEFYILRAIEAGIERMMEPEFWNQWRADYKMERERERRAARRRERRFRAKWEKEKAQRDAERAARKKRKTSIAKGRPKTKRKKAS